VALFLEQLNDDVLRLLDDLKTRERESL